MSISTIFILFLSACCFVMVLILRTLAKDLKDTQAKLVKAQREIITIHNELEVIQNVQTELKAIKNRKGPQKIGSAADGDSASRIDRLNRVSDIGKS